jgi:hypothetical protein
MSNVVIVLGAIPVILLTGIVAETAADKSASSFVASLK